MAEEIILERTYNVPLRKEFLKVPKYKRAKKAVTALKQFLVKHMKSDNVKIGKYLNDEIWKHGIKNPPHHVKLNAVKDKDGLITAELVGAPVDKKEEEETKKEEEPKVEEKEVEQVSTKSEETKVEEKPATEKKETKSPKKEPKKDK
ncbi:60S ribosomal protein L31 [Candidatus Woesearchaeota archaeon]|jgi:large subunit ribosomal protein L31e|nr:60S ribosomal protein L31 [Candidatus Woesearchaeota archaeon]